ncbi:hypothetical protein SARC_14972, partial [Sphaeroforma arctica JP610]
GCTSLDETQHTIIQPTQNALWRQPACTAHLRSIVDKSHQSVMFGITRSDGGDRMFTCTTMDAATNMNLYFVYPLSAAHTSPIGTDSGVA